MIPDRTVQNLILLGHYTSANTVCRDISAHSSVDTFDPSELYSYLNLIVVFVRFFVAGF